ncbi:hypothetical protein Tco_0624816 [Tanacetum coccineum]|uniref:Uncharacterized protein n=1 Tax=Tanacetum coccineum TaxID=301880 RepID=A0ABQ4WF20_9ASTR
MLSKKPKKATNDLHKDILGTRNPGLGYMAKRAQPALYDADTLFHPTHHPVRIWDSEEVLVHQVVSMKKMNEKPGHVRPANDFYAKLNALMFVPQKELSGDQAYWLSANEIASQASKSATPGMYTKSSKYIPPPKRANWVKPTPLPKKKQVTFQEPPRTSNRPTQKPPVQQNKKPNVPVNLSTRTKPATESRKPMPKSHTRNHRILPSKSVNARRAADHNRKLNVVDHNQFVIRSLKSVNTKTPQAKHSVNHTKKVWKATRNHNVNTTKTTWRPTRKVVGSVKPQWKPTGRHFALYDTCPLTRIMEPIVEPLELTPSVSSSSKVTMISRFTDCKLSDRKAGSKGLSVVNPFIVDFFSVSAILQSTSSNKYDMSQSPYTPCSYGTEIQEWTSTGLPHGMEYGRYGVSNVLDMAYRGFLGVRTTFDIFQNILFPYGIEYGVLGFPRYGVLDLVFFMVFAECRHR